MKGETQEEAERRAKKTAKAGGVKRTAEDEADDSERAERRNKLDDDSNPALPSTDTSMTQEPTQDKRELPGPVEESGSPKKNPKTSSICFGIGSADKVGEVTAKEQEDELRAMADEYLRTLEI